MHALRKAPDVTVVGGGIIGCSVAHALARRGADVLVLERAMPGREATWAAGGMLSPLSEALEPGPFLDLGMESLRRYPAFADAVSEDSDRAVSVLRSGKLQAALDPEEADALRKRATELRERGFAARWVDGSQARELAGGLTPEVRGGVFLEDEGQVDNRLLAVAVPEAARTAGARIRTDTAVRGVLTRGGRAVGVVLPDGESIEAGAVVLAAGAWSGQLEGLPRPVPVRPVRGQMLSVELPPSGPGTVVETSGAYLIPRPGGPLVVGSTMEEVGFDALPTPEGVAALLAAARRAFPELEGSQPVETWAGLRPGTPDRAPILGEDPDVRGLFYATGHFRNGILLAPITAAVLEALVLGDRLPPVDVASFGADRFDGSFLVSGGPGV